jgi:hypothetical protein
MPQLFALRMLAGIKAVTRKFALNSKLRRKQPSGGNSVGNPSGPNSDSFRTDSITQKVIQNAYSAYAYFEYLLRYQIGRIAPKAFRPQTVIVIAKKKVGANCLKDAGNKMHVQSPKLQQPKVLGGLAYL